MEMTIKMIAMGIYGKNTYLADSWNRLDFFIVLAGALEYCLQVENLNLTAIRTIRVLRPLRAINRIPSKLKFIYLCKWKKSAGAWCLLIYRLYCIVLLVILWHPLSRYANIGHAPLGHITDARKCAAPLFLCVLHLRNRWRPTVGRNSAPEVRFEPACVCGGSKVSESVLNWHCMKLILVVEKSKILIERNIEKCYVKFRFTGINWIPKMLTTLIIIVTSVYRT